MVAQGLADFLVKRGEAEVALFATDEFFSTLCRDDEVDPYFTKTCALMKDSEGNDLSEPPSLGTLRNALVRDLRTLPQSFVKTLAVSKEPKTKLLGCSLDIGMALGLGLRAHEDPWALLTDTKVGDSPANSQGLAHYATDLNDCQDVWKAVEAAAGELVKLRNGENGGVTPAFLRLAKGDGAAVANLAPLVPRPLVSQLAHVFAVNNQMMNAGINDANVREITETLFGALAEGLKWKYCHDDTCRSAVDEGHQIALDMSEGDWSQATTGLLTASELNEAIFKDAPKLRALLATVAAVAEAKDSDGVEAALEHYAAPVGSWRRKHEAGGIGIVGLAGATWAHEKVLRSSAASGGTLTPTLAVGFDLYGPVPFLAHYVRGGLMAPVIDVGNYASVRYYPDSATDVVRAKTESNIGLAQLFSPGLYGFISLGKTPFLVGGGCSWIPSLRTVTDATGSRDRAVTRCGGMLAIDVTVMPLVKF
jgi:hypothetical protein